MIKSPGQGVTKRRCRLSLLTNGALLIRVQMRGEGGSCGVSANEYSCAHHVTCSPNKLRRSTSIFNLWSGLSWGPFESGIQSSDFHLRHFRLEKYPVEFRIHIRYHADPDPAFCLIADPGSWSLLYVQK